MPGIRRKFAVDYFGSGKMDLLVGDFCTTITPRADLTPEEQQEYQTLCKKDEEAGKERGKRYQALRAEFAERYPGDAIFSDEADAEWSKAYQAMRASPEYKAAKEESKDLKAKMQKYLVQPHAQGKRQCV